MDIDPKAARILEIGSHDLFKTTFPDRTRILWTYRKLADSQDIESFSFRAAWRAWRDLRAGHFDLVVVWVEPYAPWNFRQLKAVIGRPLRPLASLARIFGVQLVRLLPTTVPLIAIDNEDSRTIAAHNLFLLRKAKYFFKRELPVDRWQVFQHTGHGGMPGARFRFNPERRRSVEKLRPISIGAANWGPTVPPPPFPKKTSDVFVAMTLEGGTTVRNEGIARLRELAANGVALDIVQQRISRPEFMERMSRAWLTWSPEGLGWDCFRHYEAPLAQSVPVINSPTITRYRPLIDGVHALYYHPDDPQSLATTITRALEDKEHLAKMAIAAREHVLKYHVRPQPVADALIRMALGYEDAPGGVVLG